MDFKLGCATITCDRVHDYYFYIPIRLIGAPRPRFSRGHTYMPASYTKFKETLLMVCKAGGMPFERIESRGKSRLSLVGKRWMFLCNAYYKDHKYSDQDNCEKGIADSLWADDREVRYVVERIYDKVRGDSMEIYFWKLDEK